MSSTEYDPDILKQILDAEAKKQREKLIKNPGSEYKNAHTYFNPLKFFGIEKDKKQKKNTDNKRPTPPKNHFHPDDENEGDEGATPDNKFNSDQNIKPNITRRKNNLNEFEHYNRWLKEAREKQGKTDEYSHYPDGPDPNFEGYNPDGYTTLDQADDLRIKWSIKCRKDKNSTGKYIEENPRWGNRKFLGCECNPDYKWNKETEKCVKETTGGKTRKSKNLKKSKPKSTKKVKKSLKRRQTKKLSSHK